MKVLCVAEKPSVARAMVDVILSRGGQRGSLLPKSHFNPITTITVDSLPGIRTRGSIQLIITSVAGHVFSQDFPPQYSKWDQTEPDELFSAPILPKTPETNQALVDNLKFAASGIDQLWLWLDCDREGESIADEVRSIVLSAVGSRRIVIKRAKFSALTPDQVFGAIQSLGEVDERAIAAATTRAELDLRFGAVFTRFQTTLNRGNGVLSYGGCQIPTLKIVVQRYLEHYTFRPCSFWYLQCFLPNDSNIPISANNEDDENEGDDDLDSIRNYRSSISPAQNGQNGRNDQNGQNNQNPSSSRALISSSASPNVSNGIQFRWSRPNFFEKGPIDAIHASLHTLKPQQQQERLTELKTFLQDPLQFPAPSPLPPSHLAPNLYQPKPLTVVRCDAKPTSKYRPVPLTTVELQKFACRKLAVTSQEAMDIAEQLYQEGYISYPRTETEVFPRDMEVEMKEILNLFATQPSRPSSVLNYNNTDLEQYRAYAATLIVPNFNYIRAEAEEEGEERGVTGQSRGNGNRPNPDSSTTLHTTAKYRFPRAGSKNDQAHPPIHPKKVRGEDEWAGTPKRKIYDYIVRHYLACCSLDALGKRTTAVLQCPETMESFVGEALSVFEKNFLEILPWEKWSDKSLPPLFPGTTITPMAIQIKQGSTTGPQLHTESSLINEMDRNGIGTDATMASHITTLRKRGYLFPQSVLPTPLGCALVLGWALRCPLLVSVKVRSELEKGLESIARGHVQSGEIKDKYISTFKRMYMQISNNHFQKEELRKAIDLAMSNGIQRDLMQQLAREQGDRGGRDHRGGGATRARGRGR